MSNTWSIYKLNIMHTKFHVDHVLDFRWTVYNCVFYTNKLACHETLNNNLIFWLKLVTLV